MDQKFLISMSIVSIVSGSAVALTLTFFYLQGLASPPVIGLIWEGVVLMAIGVFVLLNLRRIEAIQKRYRRR
jgi:hypothetical protein